jgi:redox-sensitive bicupin YhaK (pirin superfamily)
LRKSGAKNGAESVILARIRRLAVAEAMLTLFGDPHSKEQEMIRFRDRMARGHSHVGWLDSRHSFSFADYDDPAQRGFRTLRVINEDRVIPGAGFPPHRHRDMEILTYVLAGALEHKDSLGNGAVIRPGEVQRMSAGTGIVHSEFNPSRNEPVHFLQIWIFPDRVGLPPSYEQKAFALDERRGRARLVAAPDGRDGALTIHQDARLFVANLAAGEGITQEIAPSRGAWLQLARGIVALNGTEMREGDGAAVEGERRITVEAETDAEFLLFDLA